MGGIRDSVAGRRVTSAFMSLSNSSSWFRTGAQATEREGQEKGGEKDGARKRDSQMDKYSQKERTQTSKDHRPKTKWQRIDMRREIQRRRAAGHTPHRTDGNKGKYGEEVGEDIGRHGVGVVRTSHTGKGRFRGWEDREEIGSVGQSDLRTQFST